LVLEFIPGGELFTYLRSIGRLQTQHAAYYYYFNKQLSQYAA